jgi:hypothetical protein
MERTTGSEGKTSRSEDEAQPHDQRASAADSAHRTPKKRRKVNHGELVARCVMLPSPCCVFPTLTVSTPFSAACIYCRRSVSH